MSAIVERFDRVFPPIAEGAVPSRFYTVFTRLPDRILQVLLSIFVAAYLMAELGLYHPYTVAPLAIIFGILSWRLVPDDVVPTRAHAIASIVAIVAAIVWVGVQLPFETEFIVASRDPGIYSNLGVALATTGHSSMDVSSAVRDAMGIPNTTAALGNFAYEADQNVRLQGGNALPSLLGIGYWIGSINGLTVVNSIIGGVSLVALFSLGRRLLGAGWGLVPAIVLGISMPMVYFARAPYTEVISLAVFLGAVIWLWAAFTTGRTKDFVMAGVFAGAACMTRIDAYLGAGALVAAFIVILAGLGRPKKAFDLRRAFIAWIIPTVVVGLCGIYDLLTNFHRYVNDLGSQPKSLWALDSGLVVVGFVVIGVRTYVSRRGTPSRDASGELVVTGGLGKPLGDRPARIIALVLAILVPVLFIFWALRPLFITFHYNSTNPAAQLFVESLQRNTGLPIDGSRSYDEYSLYWFVWYFGVAFVVATGLGLSVLVYRAVTRRRPGLVVFSILTIGVALLYLNKISIAPDQMWAFRRVLPIVAPGFIIAAIWVVRWLALRTNRAAIVAGGVVGALIIVGTAGAWTPRLFVTTEYSNQANEIRAVCAQIGDHKKVVLVSRGLDSYAMTLHNFCGVEVVTLLTNTGKGGVIIQDGTPAHKKKLVETARKSLRDLEARLGDGTPVITFDSTLLDWKGKTPQPVISTIVDTWDRTLLSQPRSVDVSTRTTWMGTLTPTGLVKGER